MVKEFAATLADSTYATESGSARWLRRISLALFGTLAVAVAAHIAVPLPFTPIPLTLQPMAVLLVGLLFGPSLGCATMLLYLAEGAMGMPVFSPHGLGGVLQLAGPTGGFLWSYPLVALIAGGLYRALRSRPAFFVALYACLAAVTVLFLAGASQLAVLTHASLNTVFTAAVLPFLPGEMVKILAASGIAAAWHTRPRQ